MSRSCTLLETLAAAQDNSAPRANSFSDATAASEQAANAARRGEPRSRQSRTLARVKLVAVERGMTVQAVMLEAINDVLVKADHRPIA